MLPPANDDLLHGSCVSKDEMKGLLSTYNTSWGRLMRTSNHLSDIQRSYQRYGVEQCDEMRGIGRGGASVHIGRLKQLKERIGRRRKFFRILCTRIVHNGTVVYKPIALEDPQKSGDQRLVMFDNLSPAAAAVATIWAARLGFS